MTDDEPTQTVGDCVTVGLRSSKEVTKESPPKAKRQRTQPPRVKSTDSEPLYSELLDVDEDVRLLYSEQGRDASAREETEKKPDEFDEADTNPDASTCSPKKPTGEKMHRRQRRRCRHRPQEERRDGMVYTVNASVPGVTTYVLFYDVYVV